MAGNAKGALKAARQEAVQLTRELKEANKLGKEFDSKKAARLQEVKAIAAGQAKIVSQARDARESYHQLKHVEHIFRNQAIIDLLKGDKPSVTSALHLIERNREFFDKVEQQATKIIGQKMATNLGKVVGGGISEFAGAAALAYEAVDNLIKTYEARTAMSKKIGQRYATGQIGKQEFELVSQNGLSTEDAQKLMDNVEKISGNLDIKLPKETADKLAKEGLDLRAIQANAEQKILADMGKRGLVANEEEIKQAKAEAVAQALRSLGNSAGKVSAELVAAIEKASEAIRKKNRTAFTVFEEVREKNEEALRKRWFHDQISGGLQPIRITD